MNHWIASEVIQDLEERGGPLWYDRFSTYEDHPRSEFRDTLHEMVERNILYSPDGAQYGLNEED